MTGAEKEKYDKEHDFAVILSDNLKEKNLTKKERYALKLQEEKKEQEKRIFEAGRDEQESLELWKDKTVDKEN